MGSLIQPSIGIALSALLVRHCHSDETRRADLTWMEYVADGTVIKYHDFAQIWLHLCKVLDIAPVTESTVLSVVSSSKVLALGF